MEKRYIIEFLGVAVIVFSKLLTEANPVIMGILYFSVFWMTQGITTGFFTPFGPYAALLLGRGTYQDMAYNWIAQILGATFAILLFKPVKAYIE